MEKKIMSTRSNIAIENRNGSITSLYCHYDGYLSNNGKILAEHYSDPNKVRELFRGNGFRSLTTDPKDLDRYEGADDRIEYNNEFNFIDCNDPLFIEYVYLYKNDTWYVSESLAVDTAKGYKEKQFYHTKFQPLDEALMKLEEVA